jgi:hypothetical protein
VKELFSLPQSNRCRPIGDRIGELRRGVGFSVADEIQIDGLKKAGSISDAEFASQLQTALQQKSSTYLLDWLTRPMHTQAHDGDLR